MAALGHLGFSKFGHFNFPYPSDGQRASSCQISRISVKPLQRYGQYSILKMAAVRHLRFSKVRIFNCPYPSGGQNAPSCQISRRSVKAFRRYDRFSIFKNGGRPPSWICFTPVGTTHEDCFAVFVTVQNLVVIGAVISTVCKF